MIVDYDVAVVGAGIAGASSGWQLARRGHRVLLLDQFGIGHAAGSSHGPERLFRYVYPEPEYVRLAHAARRGWRELEADAGVELLHTTGAVDFGPEPVLRELAATCATNGVPAEPLDAGLAARRFPMFEIAGPALFQPWAARIDADRALRALASRAGALGAEVSTGERVTGLDGGTVRTARRTVRARTVVIAAGAWTPRLLDGVVMPPELVTTREQVAYFRRRDDAPWPGFVSHVDPVVYGLPGPDGLVKVGEHGTGPRVEPGLPDEGVEPVTWARLLAWVRAHLPSLDPEPVRASTCLYASGPAERFAIDRIGPVVVCAWLGGHGFKFGPELGRIVADLVEGRSPDNPFAFASTERGH